MLENLKNSIDRHALWIVSGIIFLIGFFFSWIFRKVTGRSIRDILGLISAAVVLVIVGLVIVVFLLPGLNSTDLEQRRLAVFVATVIFGGAAVLIGDIFNYVVRRARLRARRKASSVRQL